jgi:origin recognition complex subunit 5
VVLFGLNAELERREPTRKMEPLSIQRLSTLLSTSPPPFIFIHDPYTALASTYLKSNLSSIASTSQTVWVNIDCIECFTPRLLYTRIINALSGWDAHLEEGGGECWGGIERGRWDMSWDVFVQALKDVHVEILSRDGGNKKERDEGVSLSDDDEQLRFVLIFEKAERMKDFLPSLVVPITRLAELVRLALLPSIHSFDI